MLQPSGAGNKGKSAIIGLGSNLASDQGSPQEILLRALAALANNSISIQAVSRFYTTPCFPKGADYVNAVALTQVGQTATDLLSRLHAIEESMGRQRVVRWGQRTLDLDLLAYGDEVAPDLAGYLQWRDLPLEAQSSAAPDQLILPHPRLQDRAFVLVPMADIVPDWRHPVTGHSTTRMLNDLDANDVAQILPL